MAALHAGILWAGIPRESRAKNGPPGPLRVTADRA